MRPHFPLPLRIDGSRKTLDRTANRVRVPKLPDLQIPDRSSGPPEAAGPDRRPLRRRQEESLDETRVRRPVQVRGRDDEGREILQRPGKLFSREVRLLRLLQVQESLLRRGGSVRRGRRHRRRIQSGNYNFFR